MYAQAEESSDSGKVWRPPEASGNQDHRHRVHGVPLGSQPVRQLRARELPQLPENTNFGI
jgi:hypothetical protein